jgi:Domain of unknown function (DUF4383)
MSRLSYRSISSVAQEVTLWVSGGFLTLGYLGFLPWVTNNIETLSIWSERSSAELLGVFEVSFLHNVVHLFIGVGALVAAGADRYARAFLAVVGVALMMLVMYGRLTVDPDLTVLVPVAAADAWLHAVLGFVMFAAAVLAPGDVREERPPGE